MSISSTTSQSATIGGSTITIPSETFTTDGAKRGSVTIPAGATNVEIDVAVDVSTIAVMILKATTVGMTIKTNSTGAPADTLVFAANKGVMWKSSDVGACPLTTDVTKFYVTNASPTVAGTFEYGFATDDTP